MAMVPSSKQPDLSYDPDYFSEEDIGRMFGKSRAVEVAERPKMCIPASLSFSATPTTDEIDNAVDFFRRQIERHVFAPEIFAGLKGPDVDRIVRQAKRNLKKTLKGQINASVIAALPDSMNRVAIVEVGDTLHLSVDGAPLLAARRAFRDAACPYFELAKVVIDIVLVLLALVQVRCRPGAKVKDAVAEVVKRPGFDELVGQWIDPIRACLERLKLAVDRSSRLREVRDAIRSVATGLYGALKYFWGQLRSAFKQIIKILLKSVLAIASAILSLAAFIAGLFATAGAVLAASLLNLADALCSLILDTVDLVDKWKAAGSDRGLALQRV